jgi:hypothetical protein
MSQQPIRYVNCLLFPGKDHVFLLQIADGSPKILDGMETIRVDWLCCQVLEYLEKRRVAK